WEVEAVVICFRCGLPVEHYVLIIWFCGKLISSTGRRFKQAVSNSVWELQPAKALY
ncbi:MAG: DNA-directed RNA polymerase subunit N (RpoN/RPB10), partial [Flavobacteriales bacterium]